jgi:hypothetical protein
MNSLLISKKEPPDKKSLDFFTSVKLPLKHILKNPDINLPKITHSVVTCNKIIINSYLFIKLYFLHLLQQNLSLPKLDKLFVNSVMKTICVKPSTGKPNEKTRILKDSLSTFYNSHFKPLISDLSLEYKNLNTVLNYLTIDVITMYENNIKLHYVEYVERFVNFSFKKKEIISQIKLDNPDKETQKKLVQEFCRELRKVKKDILNPLSEFSSKPKYHTWISQVIPKITPNKSKYTKDKLCYDLKSNPQDYLLSMIYMMQQIENDDCKIYNVFPMRNEIIPHSIKLDTNTLVRLLLTEKYGTKKYYVTNGNLVKKQDEIWKFFFNTKRRCFKKSHYSFHHMIETDGVSCSILFLRKDLEKRKIPKVKEKSSEQYIDELKDYKDIINKKIVAYDPNKADLIYCVDKDDKTAKEFRYTQDSRRRECKIKHYAQLRLKF